MSTDTKAAKAVYVSAATKNDCFHAGVAKLGAVQVSPQRWAYYADETGTWYVTTQAELIELGMMLLDGTDGAYSHWCAGTPAREASHLSLIHI